MASDTYKLLSNTIAITAPNTVFSARAVYIQNAGAASANVVVHDPVANVQVGSVTLLPNTAMTILKGYEHTISNTAAATLTATSVAFTN